MGEGLHTVRRALWWPPEAKFHKNGEGGNS